MKAIKAYAVARNGKLNSLDIYSHKDLELDKDEEIIRVTITPDDKNKKRKSSMA